MKKVITNSFNKLNTDSNELALRSNEITNAVNITTFTQEDNQYILQNILGNEEVAGLKPGYIFLGIETFRNIAYIISGRFDENTGNLISGEIGTFPSPDWDAFYQPGYIEGEYLPIIKKYQPLRNFNVANINDPILNDASNYTSEFNTNLFAFKFGQLIEVKTQVSYDGSINIIFNDTINPVRLINSRFKMSPDGLSAALAERRGARDTNVYSAARFSNTKLFRQSDIILNLTFTGLSQGGYWKPGGYKFYFRYADADGNLTDLIESSNLVSVAEITHGEQTDIINRTINFSLKNLDPKFAFLKVYFSYTAGNSAAATEINEIALTYTLPVATQEFKLTLYGNEAVIPIDASTINLDLSDLRNVQTIEQHQFNLVFSNVNFNNPNHSVLERISSQLEIKESLLDLNIKDKNQGYRNPINNYYYTGYWARESYEIAIVYILKNGNGLSPAYPIRGIDNLNNLANYTTNANQNLDPIFGTNMDFNGYLTTSLYNENRRGVYRTSGNKKLLKNDNTTEVLHFEIDMTLAKNNSEVTDLTDGFFFVRKERVKDCVVQGMICNTAQFTNTQEYAAGQDIAGTPTFHINKSNLYAAASIVSQNENIRQYIGFLGGRDNTMRKILPAPGRILTLNNDAGDHKIFNIQGRVFPIPSSSKYFSFYSSDALVNTPKIATIFQDDEYSLFYSKDKVVKLTQDITPGFNPTINPNPSPETYIYDNVDPVSSAWQDISENENWVWIRSMTIIYNPGSNSYSGTIRLMWCNRFDPSGVNSNTFYLVTIDGTININSSGLGSINIPAGAPVDAGGYGVTSIVLPELNLTTTFQMDSLGHLYPTIGATVVHSVGSSFQTPNVSDVGGAWTAHYVQLTPLPGPWAYNFGDYGGSLTLTNGTGGPDAVTINQGSTQALSELQAEDIEFTPDTTFLGKLLYVNETKDGIANESFSTKLDRNIYYYAQGSNSPNEHAALYGDCIQYSDYIGIKAKEDKITDLQNLLTNDKSNVFNYIPASTATGDYLTGLTANANGITGDDRKDYVYRIEYQKIRFGVLANVYQSNNGILPQGDVWKNRYAHNQSQAYFPVTKRIKWSDLNTNTVANTGVLVKIFGGDCYIDYTLKRLCYGLGIPGVPTAKNWSAYTDGNQDAGLYPKGIVFPVINESNYNSALRCPEDPADNVEKGIYGKDRTFLLPNEFDEVYRGSRQLEAKAYNFGYNYDYNIRFYSGIDPLAPIDNITYQNRIFVSDRSITTDFSNGYVRFSGFNFRDYNSELGPIYKLISSNNRLLAIMENGIVQIPINQRTYVPDSEGGVFIDNANVLGQYGSIINDEYGSTQSFSVGKSNYKVYGYDVNKNVIWSVVGNDFKVISDFNVRTLLEQYQYKLFTWGVYKPKYLVKFNFATSLNQVYFTFLNVIENVEVDSKKYHFYSGLDNTIQHKLYKYDKLNLFKPNEELLSTLYYNEIEGLWKSQLSYNPLFGFNLQDTFYTVNSQYDTNRILNVKTDNRYKIWEHDTENVPYCNFYNRQDKFIFEFVLIDNPSQQKILENLILISNRVFPNRLIYKVEDYFNYENGISALPNLQNGDPENKDVYTIDLMKQRHELVSFDVSDFSTNNLGNIILIKKRSIEEVERTIGAYFTSNGITYILGGSVQINVAPNTLVDTQLFQINALNEQVLATNLPLFEVKLINFGIIQQNQEYIENELIIEIGKNVNKSVIRDKVIKVQVMYEGADYVQIYSVLSKILYSYG